MNTDLNLSATSLARGQMHRITDGQGMRVLNLQGTLWLTQDGDLRDIVLGPGDLATIERDGLTILSALADARFVLLHDDEPVPEWAWRMRSALTALAHN